jgi:hypothetical protein
MWLSICHPNLRTSKGVSVVSLSSAQFLSIQVQGPHFDRTLLKATKIWGLVGLALTKPLVGLPHTASLPYVREGSRVNSVLRLR